MPENVPPAEAARRMAGFLYLLTSLVVFPVVLMAVQDLPSAPHVTYSRYLQHVSLTHFPFETVVIGIVFIAIFLVPLRRILLPSRLQLNLIAALITALIVYGFGVFVIGHIYPISLFNSLSVCPDGYHICHSFGVYGYLMLFALTAGIAVARGRQAFEVQVGQEPAGRFFAKLLYCLLPVPLYPLIMKFEERSTISTALEYFGSSSFSYFDFFNVSLLALFIFAYTWMYAKLFREEAIISVISTVVATSVYVCIMYLLSHVAACQVDHAAVCITRAAHGLILVVIVGSTLLWVPSLTSGNFSNAERHRS
jgi:hypothetical protein